MTRKKRQMARVGLTEIHIARATGRVYYYAWRGGPALKGEPGSAEFDASYDEAIANRHSVDDSRFRFIIDDYRQTSFLKRSAPIIRLWTPWLDRIDAFFGDLKIAQVNQPEKIRPVIRRWRYQYSDTPRAADLGMEVLSNIMSHGIDPMGKLTANPCQGIKRLHISSCVDPIWTDNDLVQLKATASAEVGFAVDLAAHTGLGAIDLVQLSWSHVSTDSITTIGTRKGGNRREVIIPRYDALNELLETIPRRSAIILTNSRKMPWTANGLAASFWTAMLDAQLHERDLHFQDLRGTAAANFYRAGISMAHIAEIVGWEEDQVEKVIKRYVAGE